MAPLGSRFQLATTPANDEKDLRNQWRAPAPPGPAVIWTVLRDSRGGVAVLTQTVQVAAADP
jgi:hypothetical protein